MKPFRRNAFSLIEVVLALGIVSTAVIALMGLLGAAFGVLRQSMDVTTETQIAQTIASEITTVDFSALGDPSKSFQQSFPRYLNDEGLPQAASANASYKVLAPTLTNSQIPGSSLIASNAQKLVVTVEKPFRQDKTKSYSFLVVNNGR